MTLSLSSLLTIIILTVSTSPVIVDAQIRRRNGHRARLLEQVVWDPQESVLEEEPRVLIEDMEWGDFSMELVSISMSMSMVPLGSTKTSSKGPKGRDYRSIPEIPSDTTMDHQLLTKRSHVEDAHATMKLVKR